MLLASEGYEATQLHHGSWQRSRMASLRYGAQQALPLKRKNGSRVRPYKWPGNDWWRIGPRALPNFNESM
jgi:hypothetical protein